MVGEVALNDEPIWTRLAWGKAALLIFVSFFLINLLILDLKVFTNEEEVATPVADKSQTTTIPSFEDIDETGTCPPACLEEIARATLSGLAQPTPISLPAPVEPTVKEFYIPLGSGSTNSRDYAELIGVEGVIDMANYPNVKSIIFEASMRIPTANGLVYAKLYNVTDKHDVWNSEVYAESLNGYRAESGEINLASGRKLYRVMMKSTMGYEAILDSARIKILLK